MALSRNPHYRGPIAYKKGARQPIPPEPTLVADFGGTNGYIETGPQVGDYSDGFTISAQVYLRSFSGNPRIMAKRTATGFDFYVSTIGRPNIWAGGSNFQFVGNDVQLNTWTYLAIVFDGANTTCYKDGVAYPSIDTSLLDLQSSATSTLIGRFGSVYTDGQMSDIPVFNAPLSAAQIAHLHGLPGEDPSTTWLANWYKLNGNATDSGNQGIDGTEFGDLTYVEPTP